jgi:hypothetical protein
LMKEGLIKANDPFFSATPHENAPLYITAWIMHQ